MFLNESLAPWEKQGVFSQIVFGSGTIPWACNSSQIQDNQGFPLVPPPLAGGPLAVCDLLKACRRAH
jgi:hypothetical protein